MVARNGIDGELIYIASLYTLVRSSWSEAGLTREVEERGGGEERVICYSTHLTGFAILVSVNSPEVSEGVRV